MTLQDLVNALKKHFEEYGHEGGLGTSINNMIGDLIATGHEWRMIRRVINMVYYRT